MSKNPFVNCKSRKKRRKPRAVIAKPNKGFCPRTMVRYDDSPNEYKITWVCKMCFKFLLSEEAVHNHLKVCNTKSFNKPVPAPKSVEDMRYICEHCNRIFTRKVTLHRHITEHHKPPSDSEEDVMFDDDDKMLFEENENMAEENEIMAEENEIMAEENEIIAEENKNMAEGNEIMNDQIVIDENNMPTMVYENKIEPLVVVDENKTVVEESKKLVDESRVLVDEHKIVVDDVNIFVDQNKTLVPEEIESVKEIDVDGEKQNVCENLLI